MTTLEQLAVAVALTGRDADHAEAPDDHDYALCQCSLCRVVSDAVDKFAEAMYALDQHLQRAGHVQPDPRDDYEVIEKTVPELPS